MLDLVDIESEESNVSSNYFFIYSRHFYIIFSGKALGYFFWNIFFTHVRGFSNCIYCDRE